VADHDQPERPASADQADAALSNVLGQEDAEPSSVLGHKDAARGNMLGQEDANPSNALGRDDAALSNVRGQEDAEPSNVHGQEDAEPSNALGRDDAALSNVLGAIALAVAERLLGAHGLAAQPPPLDHPSACAALSLVRWMPGLPMPALADYLELSQAATVRVVQRLNAGGLVRTHRERGDRRMRVFVTDAGREAIERVDELRAHVLEDVLQQLQPRQRRDLLPLLRALARGLPGSQAQAMHVCRLCHWTACGNGQCPVWNAVKPATT
jgi:DNA-binding MarR family transcriptional regulator